MLRLRGVRVHRRFMKSAVTGADVEGWSGVWIHHDSWSPAEKRAAVGSRVESHHDS
jgi:hypothetical protein